MWSKPATDQGDYGVCPVSAFSAKRDPSVTHNYQTSNISTTKVFTALVYKFHKNQGVSKLQTLYVFKQSFEHINYYIVVCFFDLLLIKTKKKTVLLSIFIWLSYYLCECQYSKF